MGTTHTAWYTLLTPQTIEWIEAYIAAARPCASIIRPCSLILMYTAMVHARWFTSRARVDGRDLEVLERVNCTVVTQQAKLIFPSDYVIWWP